MKNQNDTKNPHICMFGGTRKWWGSKRIDSRGEEKGTNPVHSLSCSLHISEPPLLPPRWGAKLFRLCRKVLYAPQLPRRSSSRVGAVRWDERGRRRTGKVGVPFISKHLDKHNNQFILKVFSSFWRLVDWDKNSMWSFLILFWKAGHFWFYYQNRGHFWYFLLCSTSSS